MLLPVGLILLPFSNMNVFVLSCLVCRVSDNSFVLSSFSKPSDNSFFVRSLFVSVVLIAERKYLRGVSHRIRIADGDKEDGRMDGGRKEALSTDFKIIESHRSNITICSQSHDLVISILSQFFPKPSTKYTYPVLWTAQK
jgi:hypothetical protein